MQDYIYTRESGEKVPVAKMTEGEIHGCLSEGIEINETDMDTINATVEAVRKRLEIELTIRRLK